MKPIRRAPLARIISAAWRAVVIETYCSGRLNSERSLQAAMFAELDVRFREPGQPQRWILTEPSVTIESTRARVYPDLVICNAREAVCFIELKYTPRGTPDTQKDLRTLAAIAGNATVSVTNERFLGAGPQPREFCIAQNALFVWAGIHTDEAAQFEEWESPCFDPHYFLQLHALTHAERKPGIEIFTNAYRLGAENAIAD